MTCVSLLPGTLAADLKDQWLEVHVLDTGSDPNGELRTWSMSWRDVFADTGDAR